MSVDIPQGYYDTVSAAKILGKSSRTVRRWCEMYVRGVKPPVPIWCVQQQYVASNGRKYVRYLIPPEAITTILTMWKRNAAVRSMTPDVAAQYLTPFPRAKDAMRFQSVVSAAQFGKRVLSALWNPKDGRKIL